MTTHEFIDKTGASDEEFQEWVAGFGEDEDEPCEHPDVWFDRVVCPDPCGGMHEYCTECGVAVRGCLNDPEPVDCGHHSWAGLMQLLDQHWPNDIWPTLHHDDLARDTGARLISLLRWVDQLRNGLPEHTCADCGATTRARMADNPGAGS